MTLEFLEKKEKLRKLIDDYAVLGDEKKITEQMELFTPNITYKAFMGGIVVSEVSGKTNMEKEFIGHASLVKTYFTLNGQHEVQIDNDTAFGVSFAQIKMIREVDGKNVLTDYSVRYDDKYVFQNDKWLINYREGLFIIIEERLLTS
ncbi:nuclear transport factor 2 family protein [Flavobacterium pectinovorum]|uniref:nuclear transport factor 2 family protein n=1 Tax=Flavobacterium pectinovorum TaxID=29533 RepID=UPI001FAE1EC5|nr:nuclear transport factor 2 family protein [Flavobacterium pectinovorum]MCI9845974.1 nuclear transport factor 2 family protein [Flavobacterium pectinovorum]